MKLTLAPCRSLYRVEVPESVVKLSVSSSTTLSSSTLYKDLQGASVSLKIYLKLWKDHLIVENVLRFVGKWKDMLIFKPIFNKLPICAYIKLLEKCFKKT